MPQFGESVQNSTRVFRIHNKNSAQNHCAATDGAVAGQLKVK
jgi:hypothetical protein